MNCQEDFDSHAQWVQNGNNLTITTEGIQLAVEIVTLTDTTLKLKFVELESNEYKVTVFSRM